MVELLVVAGILLADLGNGDPVAVEGHVGVAVSKEGNDRNGKRSQKGCVWDAAV